MDKQFCILVYTEVNSKIIANVRNDQILLFWLDQLDCVEKLLDNGADPLVKDDENRTALFLAETEYGKL